MIEDYQFGIFTTVAWAVSAPVITAGLRRIPAALQVQGVLLGLLVSLLSGTVCLSLCLLPQLGGLGGNVMETVLSLPLFLAGLFTFPLATGLYYLSGYAFGGKAEVAAQFSRIKPAFSIAFATLAFHEPLLLPQYLSLAFVLAGTGCLIVFNARGGYNLQGLLLGLLTAFFWSVGEVFIKIGVAGTPGAVNTFVSLCSSALVALLVILPIVARHLARLRGRWLYAFVFHGAVSFGLGYASYYESIKLIGLGRTVIVTAFWPALALFFMGAIRYALRQPCGVPLRIWAASVLLLIGSLIQVVAF